MTRDKDNAVEQSIDPEALAYSECVRALKAIPPDPDVAAGLFGFFAVPATTRIRRVLLALSDRFGAGLIRAPEPNREPEPDICPECGQEVDE